MNPADIRLPDIPAKRYFNLNEVSELCGVKPHVLRSWEHTFSQLKPLKRRGNHSLYQHHEVLLIRRIRELLYVQGHSLSAVRKLLQQGRYSGETIAAPPPTDLPMPTPAAPELADAMLQLEEPAAATTPAEPATAPNTEPPPPPTAEPDPTAPFTPLPTAQAPAWNPHTLRWLRKELQEIHDTLWL